MPTVTLDVNTIRTAVCPAGQRKLDLYDTTIPGFVLEVRPSGGKTWYLRYRDGRGKQHQHRIGDAAGITFEQARTAAQTTRAKVILGENPAEEKKALRAIPTLEDFAQRYLDFAKGAKRSWDTDESFLRNHVLPRWAKRHLDEVRQQDIIDLQHGMRASGYAPATANRIVILTRYMWNLGKKWKVPGTETNPASGVELFEENNKRERFLTAEEVQRLVACVRDSDNPQLQYIVPLLLLLGCRKREALDAKWQDIDWRQKLWRIPKTKSGKVRHVPLSSGALKLLQGLKSKADPAIEHIFANPRTGLPFVSIFYSWDTARTEAGLPELRIHDLRHSFASFLVNAGRSLYEVQELLGHADIRTTSRYAHLSRERLREAVEVVRVG